MAPKRKPVEQQVERRGHPEMKFNKDLAEQFGITPGQDPPRELVQVTHIPEPIDIEDPTPKAPEEIAEDTVGNLVREEIGELATRLRRFGIQFNDSQQQTVVDYTMSVLAGYGGGGAIARRQ